MQNGKSKVQTANSVPCSCWLLAIGFWQKRHKGTKAERHKGTEAQRHRGKKLKANSQ